MTHNIYSSTAAAYGDVRHGEGRRTVASTYKNIRFVRRIRIAGLLEDSIIDFDIKNRLIDVSLTKLEQRQILVHKYKIKYLFSL